MLIHSNGKCFLCGDKCEPKKNFRKDWRLAATMEIRQTTEIRREEHKGKNTEDQWALEAIGQVKDFSGFVAAEGRYHVNCYVRFCSQRYPKKSENTEAGRKRNIDNGKLSKSMRLVRIRNSFAFS